MRQTRLFAFAMSALFCALLLPIPRADDGASIEGRVLDHDGRGVAGATVELADLRMRQATDAEGRYRFGGLAPGHYHLRAATLELGSGVVDVRVGAGESASADITLHFTIHREELVVTASPNLRLSSEVYQPVGILADTELATKRQPTLGETLASEQGISTTYFGPGASRPVIRGLGADRSRILEGGIDVGDASGVSPDHAVSVDTASIERVEIVRGPATLLYGSGAVGGVINVIDNRIPQAAPDGGLGGAAELSYSSAADDRTGSVDLGGGGAGWAWHAGGGRTRTDDYEIPAPAQHDEHAEEEEEDEEHFDGTLENSNLEKETITAGLSRVWDRGYFGASFSRFETDYGVPPGAHEHEHGAKQGHDEEFVRIDLDQKRWDLAGELRGDGFFRIAKLRSGLTDYEHVELEGAEVGTRYVSEGWETRVEGIHRPLGRLEGSIGVQLTDTELEAFGDEAFIEPSATKSQAVFVYEELPVGDAQMLLGARLERQEVEGSIEGVGFERTFEMVSASLGFTRALAEEWSVAGTLSRAARAPNAEELFSFGEHAATASFEIGDPDLDPETSLGLDLTVRRTAGRVSGEATVFFNRFDDFIYGRPIEDPGVGADVPVFRFEQADADFRGFELHADVELFHEAGHRLALELGSDYVRAERRADGEPLPYIPPWRYRVGLRYSGARFFGGVGAESYDDQDRVFCEAGAHEDECEEPTEGYTLVDLSLGYRFAAGSTIHEVILRGRNLSDRLARSHVSRLKDFAPLPGRDLALVYRVSF